MSFPIRFNMSNTDDINPGIIGSLMAQQECVLGTYPLTSAYLDLLLTMKADQPKIHHPSVLFVIQEILPSYKNWRFNVPLERENFGQKVLQVIWKLFELLEHSMVCTTCASLDTYDFNFHIIRGLRINEVIIRPPIC